MKVLVILLITLTAGMANALRPENRNSFQVAESEKCPNSDEPYRVDGRYILPALIDLLNTNGFYVPADRFNETKEDVDCYLYTYFDTKGHVTSGKKI